MAPLMTVSLTGGVAGAVVLLDTRQATFMQLVSYLFSVATLLFAFGKRLSSTLDRMIKQTDLPSWPTFIGLTLAQFLIAVYGGFFGGHDWPFLYSSQKRV
jgi:uncharacterized protein